MMISPSLDITSGPCISEPEVPDWAAVLQRTPTLALGVKFNQCLNLCLRHMVSIFSKRAQQHAALTRRSGRHSNMGRSRVREIEKNEKHRLWVQYRRTRKTLELYTSEVLWERPTGGLGRKHASHLVRAPEVKTSAPSPKERGKGISVNVAVACACSESGVTEGMTMKSLCCEKKKKKMALKAYFLINSRHR